MNHRKRKAQIHVSSMETRSAKRKKLLNAIRFNDDEDQKKKNVDQISDLPDDILFQILSKLPITKIAQISVLSKRWKQLWLNYPDLDFTTVKKNIFSSGGGSGGRNDLRRRSSFINQVLSRRDHQNVVIRVLRFRANLNFSSLNNVFRMAIKNNVQELDVEVSTKDYFNFPRCVLSSKSLRVFKLTSLKPGFRLPPFSILKDGFRSLISLSLTCIVLDDHQNSILDLFDDNSFPMLQSLALEQCMGLKNLRICCKNINSLTIKSCFDMEELDIEIKNLKKLMVLNCFDNSSVNNFVKINAPLLETIYWSNISITNYSVMKNLNSLDEAFVGFHSPYEICKCKIESMSRFLSGISSCQFLTLETLCIEVFLEHHQFSWLNHPFSRLKSLVLRTSLKNNIHPHLSMLFKNSPYLEKLTIFMADTTLVRRKWKKEELETSPSEEEAFWESQSEALKSFLHHIKIVRIQGFLESEDEISLLKLLLKYGKVLEEVELCCTKSLKTKYKDILRKEKIKSQIMGFPRTSSNAQILVE